MSFICEEYNKKARRYGEAFFNAFAEVFLLLSLMLYDFLVIVFSTIS